MPYHEVLLAAVLPRFRHWAGVLPVLLAAGALALTPVATGSGENFVREQEAFQRAAGGEGNLGPLVHEHAELGDLLIWWVVPLLLVALAAYVVGRRDRRTASGARTATSTPRWLTVGLAVLGVVVPVGAIVQVVLIGHSGAQAVWGYLAS